MKLLILSIHKNNFNNVCYYLSIIGECELKCVYSNIIKYFSEERNVLIKDDVIDGRINGFLKGIYADTRHLILSAILYLGEAEQNINLRKIFITLSQEECELIREINEKIITPDYKTLCYKRRYAINNMIGSFKLSRTNYENIEREMCFHWEYHASLSPLWNKRMSEFKYTRNEQKKIIEFDNDDILEDFCQKYGFLEPDEQPREIQDASTGIIEKRNWKDLYNYLNCPDILNTLDDTFQYLY